MIKNPFSVQHQSPVMSGALPKSPFDNPYKSADPNTYSPVAKGTTKSFSDYVVDFKNDLFNNQDQGRNEEAMDMAMKASAQSGNKVSATHASIGGGTNFRGNARGLDSNISALYSPFNTTPQEDPMANLQQFGGYAGF